MRRFLWLVIALALAGCGDTPTSPTTSTPSALPVSLKDVFRGANAIPGWESTEGTRTYDRDSIFDLVDGQAELFFTFGFEQVAVQRYKNTTGARLDGEVWQLATPADAYGLFTVGISGSPAAIGNDGDAEPGRRLSFWQDRYAVHVSARQPLDDSILWSFATAISQALPQGGDRPGLVRRLPPTGLNERGFVFFHEELVLQDYVWLGGRNILGLDRNTNGILAQYNLSGQAARLMLVQYPSAAQAAAGLAAFQSDQVKDLVAVDARGDLLGAVFGKLDKAAAVKLLREALE